MKIIVLYTHVLKKVLDDYVEPTSYELGAKRFHDTYSQFKSNVPHELMIVNCGDFTERDHLFDDLNPIYERYNGRGWDCGTYQAVARRTEFDLMICFNTLAYFWKPRWLEPFVRAFERNGRGVYGPTSSLEINPHL